jgi:hypothetical protein
VTKKNAEVQEFRSSGVQEFRSSELGTLLRIGATSQAYSWVSSPHGTWFQWLPFRRGLNPHLKDILNS